MYAGIFVNILYVDFYKQLIFFCPYSTFRTTYICLRGFCVLFCNGCIWWNWRSGFYFIFNSVFHFTYLWICCNFFPFFRSREISWKLQFSTRLTASELTSCVFGWLVNYTGKQMQLAYPFPVYLKVIHTAFNGAHSQVSMYGSVPFIAITIFFCCDPLSGVVAESVCYSKTTTTMKSPVAS